MDSKPPIWRRILVSSETTLSKLHDIIQIAMGWTDSHLHSFEIKDKIYQKKCEEFADDFGDDYLDAAKFKIKTLLKKGNKINYTYDFGDSWEHTIQVEDILEKSEYKPPFLIKAVGACPVEDSGGLWGYYEKLKILSNPKHPEYKEIKEWMGPYYNQEVSLSEVNKLLAGIR